MVKVPRTRCWGGGQCAEAAGGCSFPSALHVPWGLAGSSLPLGSVAAAVGHEQEQVSPAKCRAGLSLGQLLGTNSGGSQRAASEALHLSPQFRCTLPLLLSPFPAPPRTHSPSGAEAAAQQAGGDWQTRAGRRAQGPVGHQGAAAHSQSEYCSFTACLLDKVMATVQSLRAPGWGRASERVVGSSRAGKGEAGCKVQQGCCVTSQQHRLYPSHLLEVEKGGGGQPLQALWPSSLFCSTLLPLVRSPLQGEAAEHSCALSEWGVAKSQGVTLTLCPCSEEGSPPRSELRGLFPGMSGRAFGSSSVC